MKVINGIWHIVLLTVFYIIGCSIQQAFDLFIPGSIIGMLLLFTLLSTKIVPVRFIEEGSAFMLRHMPLLFLPVTVGILQFLDVFAGKGVFLIVIALISTVMVLVIVGLTSQVFLMKKGEK
ncbi:CidA/LrgA family protein [Halalkalibacter oceani]|uniref:CidA/LrgA family protein n=1 Tax=Halalkalibacter oceani TaxID=1653776 RepID=UPI0033935294